MKKFISLLLVLMTIIPMFSICSFAFHEFKVEEEYCNAGFVYIIDGKAFFSSNEAMSELNQTGRTTIYLPLECEGKRVYIKGVSRFGDYFDLEFELPETCYFWARKGYEPDTEVTYYIDFVCSENAEYDYERQIGTSDYIKFAGYSMNDTRVIFFSQNELDNALNNGEIYIEDTYLKENPFPNDLNFNKFNTFCDASFSGHYGTDGKSFVYQLDFGDGIKCGIFVNKDPLSYRIENCSCNCHQSGFMGFIWKILRFFYKLFKINPVCGCGVAHY